MHITILAIGKMKHQAQKALMDDYLRRMHWDVTIKECTEGADLLAQCPKGARIIVLDERGASLSSSAFSNHLEGWTNNSISHICCLIGGADGHSEAVRKAAHLTLSFGAMTWPHMLARLLLVEQLYRAQQIIAGHRYHREG